MNENVKEFAVQKAKELMNAPTCAAVAVILEKKDELL